MLSKRESSESRSLPPEVQEALECNTKKSKHEGGEAMANANPVEDTPRRKKRRCSPLEEIRRTTAAVVARVLAKARRDGNHRKQGREPTSSSLAVAAIERSSSAAAEERRMKTVGGGCCRSSPPSSIVAAASPCRRHARCSKGEGASRKPPEQCGHNVSMPKSPRKGHIDLDSEHDTVGEATYAPALLKKPTEISAPEKENYVSRGRGGRSGTPRKAAAQKERTIVKGSTKSKLISTTTVAQQPKEPEILSPTTRKPPFPSVPPDDGMDFFNYDTPKDALRNTDRDRNQASLMEDTNMLN
nr:uncharacterized protein LOC109152077 [Ipomoea batatas]